MRQEKAKRGMIVVGEKNHEESKTKQKKNKGNSLKENLLIDRTKLPVACVKVSAFFSPSKLTPSNVG